MDVIDSESQQPHQKKKLVSMIKKNNNTQRKLKRDQIWNNFNSRNNRIKPQFGRKLVSSDSDSTGHDRTLNVDTKSPKNKSWNMISFHIIKT